MQWLQHLFRRKVPVIPDPLWREALETLPFLHQLSQEDCLRLKRLCESFLHTKTFTGAAGLEINDQIAVLITVQACLPVLNLTLDLYRDMPGIIVYPSAFLIPQQSIDEAGVVHEWEEEASGEAVDEGGAVVLSWEDAAHGHTPGYNVVIHEFAHKIDMQDGSANGCPPFLPLWHAEIPAAQWQSVFSSAFDDFVRRVGDAESLLASSGDGGPGSLLAEEALLARLPLDPYAAHHPAEFFAVASEAFFVHPAPLAQAYPAVYRLLALYYRQDTLPGEAEPPEG